MHPGEGGVDRLHRAAVGAPDPDAPGGVGEDLGPIQAGGGLAGRRVSDV
jgi:hypothetical protein